MRSLFKSLIVCIKLFNLTTEISGYSSSLHDGPWYLPQTLQKHIIAGCIPSSVVTKQATSQTANACFWQDEESTLLKLDRVQSSGTAAVGGQHTQLHFTDNTPHTIAQQLK